MSTTIHLIEYTYRVDQSWHEHADLRCQEFVICASLVPATSFAFQCCHRLLGLHAAACLMSTPTAFSAISQERIVRLVPREREEKKTYNNLHRSSRSQAQDGMPLVRPWHGMACMTWQIRSRSRVWPCLSDDIVCLDRWVRSVCSAYASASGMPLSCCHFPLLFHSSVLQLTLAHSSKDSLATVLLFSLLLFP